MDLAVESGSILPGGVRLGRLLGEGAFARVYEAWLDSGDRVAVKVLRRREVEAERRFLREIQVSRALPSSQHVVGYRAHGSTADGRLWLAMECVDGFTLSAVMWPDNPLSVRKACGLMLQLCESFGGLHRLGIAHRDIKPANIMLADGGRTVKLMDFGLVSDAQGQNGADAVVRRHRRGGRRIGIAHPERPRGSVAFWRTRALQPAHKPRADKAIEGGGRRATRCRSGFLGEAGVTRYG